MIELQGPSQIITGDEVLEVVRIGEVVYLDGKPVQRFKEQFKIICNVQPVEGRELLLVPEGDRYKEMYFVFTNNMEKLVLVNDKIVRQGVNFQVQSVQNWGSFQELRIMRYDVGPEATP